MGHGAEGLGEVGGVAGGGVAVEDGVDGLGGGFHRQVQIGAGVAVGDRIDVDRVDFLARPAQRLEGQSAPGAHRGSVERVRHQVLLRTPGAETAAGESSRDNAHGGSRPGTADPGGRGDFVVREWPLYAAPVVRESPGLFTVSASEVFGVTRGCQLRRLRQGAGLRQQHFPLAPPYPPSLESQHSAGACCGRSDAEAPQCLHLVHQGRQGLALTRTRRSSAALRLLEAGPPQGGPVFLRPRPNSGR